MEKFEYYIYEYDPESYRKSDFSFYDNHENWHEVSNELNKLGNEGWELVSTIPSFCHNNGSGRVYRYIYTLKRKRP